MALDCCSPGGLGRHKKYRNNGYEHMTRKGISDCLHLNEFSSDCDVMQVARQTFMNETRISIVLKPMRKVIWRCGAPTTQGC